MSGQLLTAPSRGVPCAEPALRADSLYRFFRAGGAETLALKGVSLTVAAGEMVAVVGPSGSGKSTLLLLLAGMDEPDGGAVTVQGQPQSHQDEKMQAQLRAHSTGILFQSGNLIPHLSVTANITLAQYLIQRELRPPIPDLLDMVGLTARAGAYPNELSGGEVARAGLAVALANNPAVLLADEPTGELDATTETQILQLLRRRAAAGVAILVASHSPAVAAAADRVITLTDGVITR